MEGRGGISMVGNNVNSIVLKSTILLHYWKTNWDCFNSLLYPESGTSNHLGTVSLAEYLEKSRPIGPIQDTIFLFWTKISNGGSINNSAMRWQEIWNDALLVLSVELEPTWFDSMRSRRWFLRIRWKIGGKKSSGRIGFHSFKRKSVANEATYWFLWSKMFWLVKNEDAEKVLLNVENCSLTNLLENYRIIFKRLSNIPLNFSIILQCLDHELFPTKGMKNYLVRKNLIFTQFYSWS